MLRRCAAAAVMLLAACNGGGQNLLGSSTNAASGLDLPSIARAASSATLVYAGSYVQRSEGTTETYAIAQQIEATGNTVDGHQAVHFVGTETAKGSKKTLQTSFGADVVERPSKIGMGDDVVRLRSHSRQRGGVMETTFARAGNGVFDRVPEIPQALWTNTASRHQQVVDPFKGSSVEDAYAANGSYAERSVPVAGLIASAQNFADGNGVYQWPYQGAEENSSITFSPPQGKFLIVWLADSGGGGFPFTTAIKLRMWYPSFPPALASDSFRDAGTVRIPPSCGAAGRFGTSATEIDETRTRLDIVFGEIETTQRSEYVASRYGLVCLTLHDRLASYYDYTTLTFDGHPLTTTTTDETLGLQSERNAGASVAATSAALPLDVRFDISLGALRDAESQAMYASKHLIRSKA